MIAALTGRVAEAFGGCCLLDVNGVGYEIGRASCRETV